jgi:hypothetical protein
MHLQNMDLNDMVLDCGHSIAYNGRVLGEEALTESSIELQMFKISTNVK